MVSIADLVSYQEAGERLNLNYWQLKRRVAKGELEAVKLPGGQGALTRQSIEAFEKDQEKQAA